MYCIVLKLLLTLQRGLSKGCEKTRFEAIACRQNKTK